MSKKIMIVDDEPSVRATIKAVLKPKGYVLSEAKNADEAWEKMQKEKPDLILLDVMMPGMPPAELIKKMTADKKLKSTKIIYVTAVIGAKELTKGTKHVVTTIEKPFKNEELRQAIEKALK